MIKVTAPKANNLLDLEHSRFESGKVYRSGNVFIIPLDDESGFIVDTLNHKQRAYFYLSEGMSDFDINYDNIEITDLTAEVLIK